MGPKSKVGPSSLPYGFKLKFQFRGFYTKTRKIFEFRGFYPNILVYGFQKFAKIKFKKNYPFLFQTFAFF
jgi:hypothetical protein